MRLVPYARRVLACAVVIGAALWISRGVVDLAGPATDVRVAFLPSWPELVGLSILGGLALTLLQALVERVFGRTRPGATLAADALLPLAALSLVALPYLPWLPDQVPLVAALGGPLRWWVWVVVIVACLWAIARNLPAGGAPASPGRSAWWPALATAAIVAVAMTRLSGSPVYPGGDEPHYLVITQSVLADGDFRIENNHAREDYRAYYPHRLRPDFLVRGVGQVIYSVHPVGVSLLVAPGFAAAGLVGARLTLVLLAALAGLLLWRSAREVTRSSTAATFGWIAVATSATFVLHGFAIYPEIPAAVASLVALHWRRDPDTTRVALARGLALAALPWLGTKYTPMAAVIGLLVLSRAPDDRRRLVAIAVPAALSVLAWLGWFWALWGTPLPTAPYGASHQMALWHLAAGLPGLFLDQEYGIVAAAPVLGMAVAGWWRLWRRDRAGRRLVLETLLPLLAQAITVGAYAMWWGGSVPPGRQLLAALPLLGVPLAWLWRDLESQASRRAVLVMLLSVGLAVTGTLVFARNGLLIANFRDGASSLLEYLAGSHALSALVPSFTANRETLGPPLALAALWTLIVAALWWLAGRLPGDRPGRAILSVIAAGAVLAIALGTVVPRVRAATPSLAAVRLLSPALDAYDATARPIAVVYDPMRVVPPGAIPPLVRFEAVPGQRRPTPPTPVLFDLRLALPAGSYEVTFEPKGGARLSADVGVQIGRLGAPLATWQVQSEPGAPWRRTLALDLDANFVGFKAEAAFESALARITVVPVSVVDAHKRVVRPMVLGAADFGGQTTYFHDEYSDVEPAGFWVRGQRTAAITLSVPPGPAVPAGVWLRMHSGQGTTRVRLASTTWETEVALTPGQIETVMVPTLPSQRFLPLTIAPSGGFVPAEHGGPPGDRRLLGCWIEVVP